jgi:plastocyanin
VPAGSFLRHVMHATHARALGAALLGCLLLASPVTSVTAPRPTVHTVLIEAMQFSPATLEVNAGDTVVWKNKDPFPHTATTEGDGFDSGDIAAERSWKFVAAKRGSFPYYCELHKTMKATLVVK